MHRNKSVNRTANPEYPLKKEWNPDDFPEGVQAEH